MFSHSDVAADSPEHHELLNAAFLINEDGLISRRSQTSSHIHNYEARVQQMMAHQNRQWGIRPPHGLRAISAPWAEVLRTNILLIPETFSTLSLFGPDPFKLLDTAASAPRHHMHGYMVLRPYILHVVARDPVMLTTATWHRLVDHRGWASLWGEIADRDPVKRAEAVSLQQIFLPVFQEFGVAPPTPWCNASYNARVYSWTDVLDEHTGGVGAAESSGRHGGAATGKQRERGPKAPKKMRVCDPIPVDDWDQLLWEIIEVNHRSEVRALDRAMAKVPVELTWRDNLVKRAFVDARLVPDVNGLVVPSSQGSDGLGGANVNSRRSATVGLLELMSGWEVNRRPFLDVRLRSYYETLRGDVPIGSPEGIEPRHVQEIHIVKAFCQKFVEMYKRAPIAPRLPPALEDTAPLAPPLVRGEI